MNILFVVSVFFLTFCDTRPTSMNGKLKHEGSNTLVVEDSVFLPDISINGLFLNDNISIESQLGDIMALRNQEESLPTIFVLNQDKTQYLKMTFFPGSSRNQFSIFEISHTVKVENKNYSTTLKVKDFVTESGIKLGMAKQDIIKKKGKTFIKVNGNNIKYVIDDFETSNFLKEYNMPVYFAQYEFDKSNILIRYSFGFEYP